MALNCGRRSVGQDRPSCCCTAARACGTTSPPGGAARRGVHGGQVRPARLRTIDRSRRAVHHRAGGRGHGPGPVGARLQPVGGRRPLLGRRADPPLRRASPGPGRRRRLRRRSGRGERLQGRPQGRTGRRLGPDRERWAALSAIPDADRTPAEERERCLLQWRTDFSPGRGAAGHALALWETRPPGVAVNTVANRELWGDRETEDLRQAAARVTCPVTMISGSDDPRPWTAS